MKISAVICTHNPDPRRLSATLAGLLAQTLSSEQWEVLIIDNASVHPVSPPLPVASELTGLRVISEPKLGLSWARRRGLQESKGGLVVFVDDDNVLAPDYLEHALAAFERLPQVGALGGKSLGQFDGELLPWHAEFFSLLAIRDLGDEEQVSVAMQQAREGTRRYPTFAPIGAGMVLRREAAAAWLNRECTLSDRRGQELASSGDNDIVLTLMEAGWEVAYIPQLILTHLISATRLEPEYLARLNRGIQQSWTRVLLAHHASPWSAVTPWTVPLRKLKAWFIYRAWSSPAARVRWHGACGHFEGRRTVN